MDRSEKAFIYIVNAIVLSGIYCFAGASPLPHPWDDRPRAGGLSEVADVIEEGHTYERKEVTGVVELWDQDTHRIHCVKHWQSDAPLPKKFTVINGCTVDLTPPHDCSFVEIDTNGLIKRRDGESYSDYADRCRNYKRAMELWSKDSVKQPCNRVEVPCKCDPVIDAATGKVVGSNSWYPTNPAAIGRKPTEVTP